MSIDSLIPDGVNLGGWWDAYDKSTISFSSGDRISVIEDKSDGGEDLSNSEATASKHPQWSEDYWGIRWSEGEAQSLKNSTFAQDWTGGTLLISFTSRGDPGTHMLFSDDDTAAFTGDFAFQMRKDGATDKMDFEYRIDNTYSHDLNANVVDGWDQAEKRVVTFSFSNAGDYRRIRLRGYTSSTDSAIFDYYDSGEVSELDNMSGTDSGDEGLWLGAQSASTDRVVDMDMHEIILLDAGMPGADATARGAQLAVLEDYMLNHGPPKTPTQTQPGIGLSINSRR